MTLEQVLFELVKRGYSVHFNPSEDGKTLEATACRGMETWGKAFDLEASDPRQLYRGTWKFLRSQPLLDVA